MSPKAGFYIRVSLAVSVACIAAFFFLQPIFSSIQNWGLYDWDQHFFYHGSPRISLLTFHELPLWTPYYCGGNVLLANPQSPFLSPFFAFVLLLGAVVGLKVEALAFLAIGLLGMFLLARKLGCTSFAAVFAAVVFMFSSWYASRVVVGHTTFFPFALMPFAFFFYLNAASLEPVALASRARWALAAALSLAVMFLSGGIYPVYATVILLLFYSLLASLSARKISPLAVAVAILVFSALVASAKLVPVVDFTAGVGTEKDVQLTSVGIVLNSLVSRSQLIPENDLQTGRDRVPEGRQKEEDTLAGRLPWRWHEYSAYIGIIPLLLAILVCINFRRNWKLIASALFFLALAFGNYLPVGPWQLIRELPFFSSLHGPSRFIIVFVFFVALLAAKALSSIKITSSRNLQAAIAALLCVVVAADLFMVSRPLLNGAFPDKPIEIKSTTLGSPEFIQMLSSAPDRAQYSNLLQGIGTLNCYERLHLRTRALPQIIDEVPYSGFIGNAYIAETNETLNFTHFSPLKISLKLLEVSSESTLVINQNYYKGWYVTMLGRGGAEGEKPAVSYNGILAANVFPADSGSEVAFRFKSRAFLLGAIISLASMVVAAVVFWKPNIAARVLSPAARLITKLESYVFRQS